MTLPNSVQTGDPGHVEHHNAIKTLLDERITAATASATYPTLVNVAGYGAVGDGVADDTAAIQSALTAVANGGTVYFPRGTYRVTAGLTITGPTEPDGWQGGGIHLVGASARNTEIVAVGGITLLDFTANRSAFSSIEKMSLVGPGKATASSVAINAYQTPHLRLDQAMIRGFETGVQAYDCTGWTWSDVRVWYCGTGLKAGYNSDTWVFTDVEFRDSDLGVLLGWATGSFTGASQFLTAIKFLGCIFAYNTLGVRLADKDATGVTFDGGYWEGNGKEMEIGVSGRAETTGPLGVDLRQCFFSVTVGAPRPVGIDIYNRASVRLTDCSVDRTDGYTIFVKANDEYAVVELTNCFAPSATAMLQIAARNFDQTATGMETFRARRQTVDFINFGNNIAAGVSGKETRYYNPANRVYESWSRRVASTDAVVNEFRMTDVNGVLQVGRGSTSAFIAATNLAALPAASANYRGCLAIVEGGAGVADVVYACRKNAADAYEWVALH